MDNFYVEQQREMEKDKNDDVLYILEGHCKDGNIIKVQEILNTHSDFNILAYSNITDLLTAACEEKHIETAKWLFNTYLTDISLIDVRWFFARACENNNLEIAQWWLKINSDINISYREDFIFRQTCHFQSIDVAKWLLEIKPTINIRSKNDSVFKVACDCGHLSIAQWLVSLKPDLYEIISLSNGTNEITYKIKDEDGDVNG